MRDRGFLLLIAALMLAAGGLILVNFFNHSMIRRQLFGILPIIAAIAGYAIWRLATARPLLLWLAGANIAAAAVAVAALVPSHVDFNRFAAAMREAQAACPSLVIYPVMPNDLENAPPLDGRFTGVAAPEPVGYDQIARKWHLRLQPVERDTRLADRQCGAMIWSENVWLDAPISAAEIARRARVSATSEQIEHAHLLYDRQSLLLVLPPG